MRKDLSLIICILVVIIIAWFVYNRSRSCSQYRPLKGENIYINFTTIPSRIKHIEPVIKSLLRGENIRVCVNIPITYKRFSERCVVPDFIKKNKEVSVYRLKQDYGPLTKIIGPLLNPEIKGTDIVVVTDDDVPRSKEWITRLAKHIRHDPTQFYAYVNPSYENRIVRGIDGYGFIKDLLDVQNLLSFWKPVASECFLVDDHFLTAYFKWTNITFVGLPRKPRKKTLNLLESLRNNKTFTRKGESEECRKAIHQKFGIIFPFWCCIGCCPPSPELPISSPEAPRRKSENIK